MVTVRVIIMLRVGGMVRVVIGARVRVRIMVVVKGNGNGNGEGNG